MKDAMEQFKTSGTTVAAAAVVVVALCPLLLLFPVQIECFGRAGDTHVDGGVLFHFVARVAAVHQDGRQQIGKFFQIHHPQITVLLEHFFQHVGQIFHRRFKPPAFTATVLATRVATATFATGIVVACFAVQTRKKNASCPLVPFVVKTFSFSPLHLFQFFPTHHHQQSHDLSST